MKTNLSFLGLLVCSLIAFSSCKDDDNYVPEALIVKAFNTQYPNATRVEWETKAGYKVADFILNAKECEAWFDIDGTWVLTETDILFNELPAVVRESFSAGTYGTWRVDDVDKLERPDAETVYVIEVEGAGEVDLYYAEDGTLIKAVNDGGSGNHQPTVIPGEIVTKIKEMYPNASFLEFEKKGSFLEIDIRDGKRHKEVLFDSSNNWVSTEWEISVSEVPAVVLNSLRASEYKNYKIDDVDALEKPDGFFYVFELESNPDIYVTIKSDGTIIP